MFLNCRFKDGGLKLKPLYVYGKIIFSVDCTIEVELVVSEIRAHITK